MRPEITGKKILSLEERFGVTVAIAAEYVGISKSRIYELLADGSLAGRVIRGRRTPRHTCEANLARLEFL